VAAFPADLPGGDHQMTLAVELTLAARWSSARRQAEIGEVLSQLDQAGISYTLIEVEAGELVYLPKERPGLLRSVTSARPPGKGAAARLHGPSEPGGKGLAAQRGPHELYSLGGGGQAEAFLAIGGEHLVGGVRRHQLGEFPAAGAVPAAGALDAAVRVVPGRRRQRRRMAAQHLMLPVLRRQDVQ
jgi:hypothetical protein